MAKECRSTHGVGAIAPLLRAGFRINSYPIGDLSYPMRWIQGFPVWTKRLARWQKSF